MPNVIMTFVGMRSHNIEFPRPIYLTPKAFTIIFPLHFRLYRA